MSSVNGARQPTRPAGAPSSRSRHRRAKSGRKNVVTRGSAAPSPVNQEEVARRELQEARWSAMCIQRCFRGYLARSKLLPHFRYLRTMLSQVDIGQVFALYLGWQNEQDERLGSEERQQRWLAASAKMRKLVMDSERLNKVAVRAGSTALGAFASQRNNLVLTARSEYQFELLAKYVALDIKGVFNFQGLVRNTALARLRSRSSDGLAFADALNEGNFMVFVRDCRLWPTAVTHRYLRELFRKYALLHLREGHKLVALRCFRQNVDPHGRLHPSDTSAALQSCGVAPDDVIDEMDALMDIVGEGRRIKEPAFMEWWADYDARMEKLDKFRYDDDMQPIHSGCNPNFLGLTMAAFTLALKELAIKVMPPGSRCECASCRRNYSNGARGTPAYRGVVSLHAAHALRCVLEDHLAGIASDARRHKAIAVGSISRLLVHSAIRDLLLRYEIPLRNIYCYYVSQGWLLSRHKQLSWEQVVRERLTMGYVDFLKFCSDFKLFPGVLTNDLASGFQVLQLFLGAKHGNRAAPGHRCEYPDLPEMASQPRVCHVCGWEEYRLSPQERRKLGRSFAQWDKDGNNELDTDEVAPLLRSLGKAPTRAALQRIMKFMDVDGNGQISFDEFIDGLTKGEELSYRAKKTFLSLPEFVHCLLGVAECLLAQPEVAADLPTDNTENAFRLLLERFIVPRYEESDGRGMGDTVQTSALQVHDEELPALEEDFRAELHVLYDRYTELLPGRKKLQMDIDLFELFVADCRLFRFVGPDTVEVHFMKNTGEDGTLDKRQFHDTCKDLLRENYIISRRVDGSFDPSEYTRPFEEGNSLTPYGISVRAAVSRLKTAYEVYGMPSRTKGAMKAWHVRQQKGKSPTKFRVAQRHGAMRSILTGMEQRRPMAASDRMNQAVHVLTGGFANEEDGVDTESPAGGTSAFGSAEPMAGIVDIGAPVFQAQMLSPAVARAPSIASKPPVVATGTAAARGSPGKASLLHWTKATATARMGAVAFGLRLSELVAAAEVAPTLTTATGRMWSFTVAEVATAHARRTGHKLSTVTRMQRMRSMRAAIAEAHAAGAMVLLRIESGHPAPKQWPPKPRRSGTASSVPAHRRRRSSRANVDVLCAMPGITAASLSQRAGAGAGGGAGAGANPADAGPATASGRVGLGDASGLTADGVKFLWRDKAGIPRRRSALARDSEGGIPASIARRRAQRKTAQLCRRIIRNAKFRHVSSAARKEAEAAAAAQERQNKQARYGFRMKEGAAAAAARDNVAALAAWEAALETARELKEPPRIIAVLERMGLAAADLPDGLAMASQYLKEAIRLARKEPRARRLLVGLLDGLARVQIKQDLYVDAAKGHLEQLMFATAEHIKEGAQWRLKAQAFDGYTRALMSVGLWREALWVLHKWLLLAEKVRDKGEQARVHGLTGVVHLREGSLSLAMTSFEQELPLAMLDPPGVSQIEANLHLAQLHTDLLEWDEGIKYADHAVSLARRAGERVHLAQAYTAVAYTTLLRMLAHSSTSSVFQAITLQREYLKHGSERPLVAAIGTRKETLSKIERLLVQARKIFVEGRFQERVGVVMGLQAQLEVEMGKAAEARANLTEALTIAAQVNDWYAEASHLATVARLCELSADQKQAMSCWATCLLIATTTGCKGLASEAHGGMGISSAMRTREGAVEAVGHHVERLHICNGLKNIGGQVVARCDAADACYLVALRSREEDMGSDNDDEPLAGGDAASQSPTRAAKARSPVPPRSRKGAPRSTSRPSTAGSSAESVGSVPTPVPFPRGLYIMHHAPVADSVVPAIVAALASTAGARQPDPAQGTRSGAPSVASGGQDVPKRGVPTKPSLPSTSSDVTTPCLVVDDEEARDLLVRAVEMYSTALPMCHRTGQFHVAARAHGALGATKALLGESHGAIQEWHAAAGLYRKQGNRAGLALAFEQIGVNYTMLNCLKAAMKSFEAQANLEEEIAPGGVNHLRAKANLAGILRAQYHAATAVHEDDGAERDAQLPMWMQVTTEEVGQGKGGAEGEGYGFGADSGRAPDGGGGGADLFSPMR